jgi:hypothetical protein
MSDQSDNHSNFPPLRSRSKGELMIRKRDGVTSSERHLGELANRTFLSLWSYPGVYRAQRANATGDGKELCDLLIVFEDHVIIFSDKTIEFQSEKPIRLAWSRWY